MKFNKILRKNLPILLAGLLIVVLISLMYKTSLSNSSLVSNNVTSQPEQQQATSSATEQLAKPSPTVKPVAIPIPAQSGRSVKIPILTYHFIGNNPNPEDKARDNLSVSPEKFEEQMKYLAENGYQTISFDTLYAALNGQATLPAKAVIVTFDDGYIDFYLNAYPILRKYNIHAVSFLPTGLINGSYYMTWDQVREINASGLVSFQAHSVNHPNLTSLSDDQLKYQIAESKRILEATLGKPVNTFAYPYGISDPRAWTAVKNAGFIGAVGTWSGSITSEGTIFNMPRLKIPGTADINYFASRVQ